MGLTQGPQSHNVCGRWGGASFDQQWVEIPVLDLLCCGESYSDRAWCWAMQSSRLKWVCVALNSIATNRNQVAIQRFT